MATSHLVVDGSNIATEGRSLPSLPQLLDAVDSVTKEFKPDAVTVIVDATFGHRIDESERDDYERLVNSAEIITPPAGVIGRGDAFILEIADRADAVVLSNDSFQEFHGKFEWLFTEGRLVGGKFVPGVGWIFLARSPVRGPTSRRAVSDAKRKRRGSQQAEASGPKKSTKRSSKSSSAKSKKASSSGSGAKASARKSGGKEPEPYNEALPFIEFVGAHAVGSVVTAEIEQFSSHGAYVMVDGTRAYIPLKALADPAPRSAREVLTMGESREFVVAAIDTPRRGIDLVLPDGPQVGVAADGDDAEAEGAKSSGGRGKKSAESPAEIAASDRTRRRSRASVAPDEVAEERTASRQRSVTAPPPAVEEIDESTLSVSQRRKLRVQRAEADKAAEVAAETARQAAQKPAAQKPATQKPATQKSAAKKAASRQRAAPKKAATKASAAKRSPAVTKAAGTKRAPVAKKAAAAKKAPATKRAPATKKAAAKKATTKKAAVAKKATTKKTSVAKKATAKKAGTAKKATAKKSPAKKTSAVKKAATKRAPAKKTANRRSAANKTSSSDDG